MQASGEVHGGAAVVHEAPSTQSGTQRDAEALSKGQSPAMTDFHIRDVPLSLLRDAKTFAASKGWTLKQVVTDAVREYLERKGIYGPNEQKRRTD
jgi:hypothetical protein